jgi:hypothetical protein
MKNLLIVGGTGRNVGKTELVCRIINKTAATHEVYALKVSAIHPDEELYHGDHSEEDQACRLFEETRIESGKDTARMLKAGAVKVFYLRSDDAGVAAGFAEFSARVPAGAAIVCESNSLSRIVQPGLFVMVKTAHGQIKPRAVPQLERADLVIVSDGTSGFPELERIEFHADTGWTLRDSAPKLHPRLHPE